MRQLVGMIGRTIQNKSLLSNDETNAFFEVVTNYTYALDTLDNYDYERLTIDSSLIRDSDKVDVMISGGNLFWQLCSTFLMEKR